MKLIKDLVSLVDNFFMKRSLRFDKSIETELALVLNERVNEVCYRKEVWCKHNFLYRLYSIKDTYDPLVDVCRNVYNYVKLSSIFIGEDKFAYLKIAGELIWLPRNIDRYKEDTKKYSPFINTDRFIGMYNDSRRFLHFADRDMLFQQAMIAFIEAYLTDVSQDEKFNDDMPWKNRKDCVKKIIDSAFWTAHSDIYSVYSEYLCKLDSKIKEITNSLDIHPGRHSITLISKIYEAVRTYEPLHTELGSS